MSNHRPMKKCPKKGCEIEVAPDTWGCTKHWNELSWKVRHDWMFRNNLGAKEYEKQTR